MILKLFESTRQSMVGMVMVALMPFFWADASWPIPEMLAVALVLTALLAVLVLKPALLLIPVIVAVVFTHGGLSIALIVFFAVFYVFKIRSSAKVALLEAVPIFLVAQVAFIGAAGELSSYGRSPSGLASELGASRVVAPSGKSYLGPQLTTVSPTYFVSGSMNAPNGLPFDAERVLCGPKRIFSRAQQCCRLNV